MDNLTGCNMGTSWVAPGDGATWAELQHAFLDYSQGVYPGTANVGKRHRKTNLALTGNPIMPYDRIRWESGNVS